MRRYLMLFHLYVAAFVAPALILIALSGGLYLVGIKGETTRTVQDLPIGATLDFDSDTLKEDITELLRTQGVDHKFETVRSRPDGAVTRPTSRVSYAFRQTDGVLTASRVEPDLQKTMIELHKGHGPALFALYQKLVAISLMLIVLSDVWMGLTSKPLRNKTAIATGLGFAVFTLLAFLI